MAELLIRVYLVQEDRVVQLPLSQYIEGVLAAEMPADFHMEALKAQTFAARTYIARRMAGDRSDMERWGEKAKSADVTDTVQHQAFLTDEMLKKRWGKSYETKKQRVRQAVQETKGQVITYEGEPIYAAFFSTSNGWTENSEDYFQSRYPYLRSVSSSWDQKSPKYWDEITLPVKEFVNQLENQTKKAIAMESFSEQGWMRIIQKTTGKRIGTISIGDQDFTGREVREAIKLPSSDFSWKIEDDQITLKTRGYGHGVGMSQWGANLMAQEGKQADEIIQHYYQNVHIEPWETVSSESID